MGRVSFLGQFHPPRQKQSIENKRKPNASGLAGAVPQKKACENTDMKVRVRN